jgi:hypothetical protein
VTHEDAFQVTLSSGVEVEERRYRSAWLRPLSGHDESFLTDTARAVLPAARTTLLLTRCLLALGPLSPVSSDAVKSLTTGDREVLLLHLRRLTLGERISCVLRCPEESCGQKMDLDIGVSDLLVPPSPLETTLQETVLHLGDRRYRIRFRLPNGGDQEEAALLARDDPQAAVRFVIERCVKEVEVDGTQGTCEDLDEQVTEALGRVMTDLDPQAEMLFNLTCPACGATFMVPFDAADYLFRELSCQREGLYKEVHQLAFHYHWSESEILAMSRSRRRLYLGLLAESLGTGRVA